MTTEPRTCLGSDHWADCPKFEVEDGVFGDPMSNPANHVYPPGQVTP